MTAAQSSGRPVGRRIRAVLAAVEAVGHASTSDISAALPGVARSNIAKYCRRAEDYKLLTIERANPLLCCVVENWRDLIDRRAATKAADVVALEDGRGLTAHAIRSQPNSVWALGARG